MNIITNVVTRAFYAVDTHPLRTMVLRSLRNMYEGKLLDLYDSDSDHDVVVLWKNALECCSDMSERSLIAISKPLSLGDDDDECVTEILRGILITMPLAAIMWEVRKYGGLRTKRRLFPKRRCQKLDKLATDALDDVITEEDITNWGKMFSTDRVAD